MFMVQKQDNRMVIPRFFYQAKKNIPITVYGNGEQTRDFTYIDDAINRTYDLSRKLKMEQKSLISVEIMNTL